MKFASPYQTRQLLLTQGPFFSLAQTLVWALGQIKIVLLKLWSSFHSIDIEMKAEFDHDTDLLDLSRLLLTLSMVTHVDLHLAIFLPLPSSTKKTFATIELIA
jgi:hypothetical protein